MVARWRHRAYFVMLRGPRHGAGRRRLPVGGRLGLVAGRQGVRRVRRRACPCAACPGPCPWWRWALAVLAGAGVTSLARRWPRTARPLTVGVVRWRCWRCPRCGWDASCPRTCAGPRRSPTTGRRPPTTSTPRATTPGCWSCRARDFASYRWGNTVDPDPARPDGPPLGAARAHPLRLAGLRQPAQRLRPAPAGAHGRPRRRRRPSPGSCGRATCWCRATCSTSATTRPGPATSGTSMHRRPGWASPCRSARGDPNHHRRRRAARRRAAVADRPRPARPARAGRAAGDRPGARSSRPTRSTRRCWWRATAPAWSTRPAPGSSTAPSCIRYSASLDDERARRRARRRRRPAAHRLQPQAGRALDHRPPHPGLHRAGRRASRSRTTPPTTACRCSPTRASDAMTVADERGGVEARATRYGNPITFTTRGAAGAGRRRRPRDRLAHGGVRRRPRRAHRARPGASRSPPTTSPSRSPPTARATASSPRSGCGSTAGRPDRRRRSAAESRDAPGQRDRSRERTFDTLSIEILADTAGVVPRYAGLSSVGFAEVEIGDEPPVHDEPSACRPTCSTPPAPTAIDHPLAISLTRQRQDPTDTTRLDEEQRVGPRADAALAPAASRSAARPACSAATPPYVHRRGPGPPARRLGHLGAGQLPAQRRRPDGVGRLRRRPGHRLDHPAQHARAPVGRGQPDRGRSRSTRCR